MQNLLVRSFMPQAEQTKECNCNPCTCDPCECGPQCSCHQQ